LSAIADVAAAERMYDRIIRHGAHAGKKIGKVNLAG
jgi:hypothetical protein